MGQMETTPDAVAGRLFSVSVRRAPDATSHFGLRFQCTDGKGILRVTRPGVLIDPPARQSGEEKGLTANQVRSSRFLHARDGGQHRVAFLLARLDDAALERLPPDRWFELRPTTDGGGAHLELPELLARVDHESPVEELTSPQQMLEDLRDELSSPGVSTSEHTPVAPLGNGLEMEGWAVFDIREEPVSRALAVVAPPPPVVEAPAPPPAPSPAATPSAPQGAGDVLAFHQRNTTLVRFLRRRLLAEEQRVRLLEAQMRARDAQADPGNR